MYLRNRKREDFRNNTSLHKNALNNEDRHLLNCYCCGRQGFIKTKCSTRSQINKYEFSAKKLLSCFAHKSQNPLIKVRIQGMHGIACAHIDFMHCIAGEILNRRLQEKAKER